ncbi:hypothetical protein [Lapidilactobacillus gannanensis]|uniref:Uncharacterized protein n=1 Tax=Lapidilactobacillus gannanensis TaxID=2486002 RepID=A0ABW4BKP3_9LACO|nr:hypothetical protein [Lapidilactobacillus gannanensis]
MTKLKFKANQQYGDLSGTDLNWFATHRNYSDTASWLIYQDSLKEAQNPPATIGNTKGDRISFRAAVQAKETNFNGQTMLILSNPASQKTVVSDADFEAFHHPSTTDRRLRYLAKHLQPNQFKLNLAGAFVTDMITNKWDSNPDAENVWANVSYAAIVEQLLSVANDLLVHNQCRLRKLDLVLGIHKSRRSDKIVTLLLAQLELLKAGPITTTSALTQAVQADQIRVFRLPFHPGIQGKGAQQTIPAIRAGIKRIF